jgi:hypothetical protein
VYIVMPPLSSMKAITERVKAISNHLIISANSNGEFVFKIESDNVNIETFYKELVNPEPGTYTFTPMMSIHPYFHTSHTSHESFSFSFVATSA